MTPSTTPTRSPALYTPEGIAQLNKIIFSHGGLNPAATALRLSPSSLEKILSNKRLSVGTLLKIKTLIGPFCEAYPHTTYFLRKITSSIRKTSPGRTSRPATDKLLHVHALFLQHGSLAAAGKHLGISRERTRQLLVIGNHRGLFTYTRKRSFLPRMPIGDHQ